MTNHNTREGVSNTASLPHTISPLTFSVVINTTDREAPLSTLLKALESQSYPHFEVIPVVGPTKDATIEMLSH
jgi:hypothetical protein